MLTLELGFFPLMGLLVAAVLYGVERWVLRLKCTARGVQAFIMAAMMLTTVCSLVTLSRSETTPVVVDGLDRDASPLPLRGEIFPQTAGGTLQTPPLTPLLEGRGVAALSDAHEEHGVGALSDAHEGHGAAALSDAHEEQAVVERADVTHVSLGVIFADASPFLGLIYIIGVVAVLLWMLAQLLYLHAYRRRQTSVGEGIYLTDDAQPFSFGRSIFLPRRLPDDIERYVLLHERSHLSHRHFVKLCALQVLVALCWWNPFAWLFLGEMRLGQELQVDDDVLRSGEDREAYQLALLRVCVSQPGKWILMRSTFNLQPLKQRIIFMNTTMNQRQVHCREMVAALLFALVVAAAVAIGCQSHVSRLPADHRHPMRGCWTMDWIADTGSGMEVHPVSMHYGFYNDSTFLCFSYQRRQGVNMRFSISGEGYTWRGDTLVSADGRPTDYTFPDDHTVVFRWYRDSTQNAGVPGPDITEQWSRIEPNADIVTVFRAVVEAAPRADRPMDGVWVRTKTVHDWDHTERYCLVNDTIFMQLRWNPTTVVRGFRYAGSGLCGSLSMLSSYLRQPDADHLELLDGKGGVQEAYRRTAMPPHLLRAFAPAAYINEE